MTETISARRSATREKLMDAATTVFAEKGVSGASVEEICERAGFTRGAFYSNFDTKDALCLALLQRQADEQLAATKEAIAALPEREALSSLTLEELIARAVGMFLRSQRSDRASVMLGAELRLHAVREGSLRAGYRDFVETAGSTFAVIIEDAAAALGYRLAIPTMQLISVLHGVYEHSAISALLADDAPDAEDRARLLAGVVRSLLVPA